jgi:hypothetical protein
LPNCEKCNREVALPFTCSYCGRGFCDEHRLPESHECSNQPTVAPPFARPQTPSQNNPKVFPSSYAEPTERTENMEEPRARRHFPVRKVIGAILTIMIVSVILGGFAYAYINKLNTFNQTKSYLESLGFNISNNVSGMDISTFIKAAGVVPMVDLASFISIARQYNSTTIYEQGFSFYVVTAFIIVVTAYEYTPNNSIWWIWGWNMA